MKNNLLKLFFISIMCLFFITKHNAQTRSDIEENQTKVQEKTTTDSLDIVRHPAYALTIKPQTDLSPEKWEQIPISLFHDKKEGERYLEGRATFMGSGKELGLRIEIAIKGNAFEHFGEMSQYTPIVINLVNKKSIILRVHHYQSIYDPKQHKTFYSVAFTMDKEYRRILSKHKVASVDVNWFIGKSSYEILQDDALIQQLENIRKAQEDGIIKKR